jgi:hypothetical protein
LGEQASANANASTALFVTSGVLIATGVVLIATSPSPRAEPREKAAAALRVTLGGARLRVRF